MKYKAIDTEKPSLACRCFFIFRVSASQNCLLDRGDDCRWGWKNRFFRTSSCSFISSSSFTSNFSSSLHNTELIQLWHWLLLLFASLCARLNVCCMLYICCTYISEASSTHSHTNTANFRAMLMTYSYFVFVFRLLLSISLSTSIYTFCCFSLCFALGSMLLAFYFMLHELN